MKKIIRYLLLLLLFIPISVKGYSYGIENYFINATLEDNGDLTVEEYYYLNGSYNGTTRELLYSNSNLLDFDSNSQYYGGSKIHNGSGIELESIKGLAQDSNFDFSNINGDEFEKTNSGSIGSYGIYESNYISNGIGLKIYIPSNKNKAIYIKYKIKNIAVKHDDVGELFWTIFSSNNSESIAHFKVTINFKSDEELRVWAHGPLYGEVKKENSKLIATIDGLSSHKALDVRATFSKNIIDNSYKKTNTNSLDKILRYEEDKAAQANYTRKQNLENDFQNCEAFPERNCYNNLVLNVSYVTDETLKSSYEERLTKLLVLVVEKEEKDAILAVENAEFFLKKRYLEIAEDKVATLENKDLKNKLEKRLRIVYQKIIEKETKNEIFVSGIYIILIILTIIIMINIYLKYDKEYKRKFNNEYYRDIPDGYNPTLLSYLLKRKVTNDSISATVLDLINKNVILYNKIDDDYELTKSNNYNNGLTTVEEKVIKLIFSDSEKIRLKEMKKLARRNYSSYMFHYDQIKLLVKTLGEKFYETNKITKVRLLSGIYIFIVIQLDFLILIFSSIINDYIHFSSIYAFILFIVLIIYIYYLIKVKKRTKEANEDYGKWMGLKKFLNDFSKFDDRELQDIKLWEKYLVYAHVLGISKKLIKDMKLKEVNIDNELVNNGEFYRFSNIVSNTIHSSYRSAVSRYNAVHAASSWSSGSSSGHSWSSGSGGGGGFSSGGGSGGGGGSVGRF